jgi:hypothetical protein
MNCGTFIHDVSLGILVQKEHSNLYFNHHVCRKVGEVRSGIRAAHKLHLGLAYYTGTHEERGEWTVCKGDGILRVGRPDVLSCQVSSKAITAHASLYFLKRSTRYVGI